MNIPQIFYARLQRKIFFSARKRSQLSVVNQRLSRLVEQHRLQTDLFKECCKTKVSYFDRRAMMEATNALNMAKKMVMNNEIHQSSILLDTAQEALSSCSFFDTKGMKKLRTEPVLERGGSMLTATTQYLDVTHQDQDIVKKTKMLLAMGAGFLESGLLNEASGEALPKLDALFQDYQVKSDDQNCSNRLKRHANYVYQQLLHSAQRYTLRVRDVQAQALLESLDEISNCAQSGVSRILELSELNRLLDSAKQNTIGIRLGIVGRTEYLETFFSKLSGKVIGLDIASGKKNPVVLWRVDLEFGKMLYIIGLIVDNWIYDRDRIELVSRLNASILLNPQSGTLTRDEQLALFCIRVLCGEKQVCLRGDYSLDFSNKNSELSPFK